MVAEAAVRNTRSTQEEKAQRRNINIDGSCVKEGSSNISTPTRSTISIAPNDRERTTAERRLEELLGGGTGSTGSGNGGFDEEAAPEKRHCRTKCSREKFTERAGARCTSGES